MGSDFGGQATGSAPNSCSGGVGCIELGEETGQPTLANGSEWLSRLFDQSSHSAAGGFGLHGDVGRHPPLCSHPGTLVLVPDVNAAVGQAQDVQLQVNFLKDVPGPLHRQDDINIYHGIDGVEARRPPSVLGNQLDERSFKYARARTLSSPPRIAPPDPQPPAKLVFAE